MICRWCNTEQKSLEYSTPPVCTRCGAINAPLLDHHVQGSRGRCSLWVNPDGTMWLDVGGARHTFVGVKAAAPVTAGRRE